MFPELLLVPLLDRCFDDVSNNDQCWCYHLCVVVVRIAFGAYSGERCGEIFWPQCRCCVCRISLTLSLSAGTTSGHRKLMGIAGEKK